MIYFKKSEIHLEGVPVNEVKSLLLRKTYKVDTLFDFHQTLGWILSNELHFAGKEIGEHEFLVSRFRHAFFQVVPRVVTKVKFESEGTGTKVELKTRLSIYGAFAFMGLFIVFIAPIISAIISFNLGPFDGLFILVSTISMYFIAAAYYESRQTERMIEQVIKGIEIKNIFAV